MRLATHSPEKQHATSHALRFQGSKAKRMLAAYDLVEKLGEGTFSEVFKWKCRDKGTIVAVKCMKDTYETIEEVRMASRLYRNRHNTPYFVPVTPSSLLVLPGVRQRKCASTKRDILSLGGIPLRPATHTSYPRYTQNAARSVGERCDPELMWTAGGGRPR